MKWFLVSTYNDNNIKENRGIVGKIRREFSLTKKLYEESGVIGNISYSCVTTRNVKSNVYSNDEIVIIGDISVHNRLAIIKSISNNHNSHRNEYKDVYLIKLLYEKYGINGVTQIQGEFSFVLIDLQDEKTFMIRDQIGIKTLFWHENHNGLHIASDLFILRDYFIFSNLDKSYFINYLECNGNIDSGKTPFKNVYRVESGNYVTNYNDRVIKKKYWDLKEAKPNVPYESEEDCIQKFKDIFLKAVSYRVSPTEGNSLMLSGGMDSTSIYAATQILQYKNVIPISAVFDELTDCDERKYSDELLKRYEAEGVNVTMDDNLQYNSFPKNIPFCYEPSVNSLSFEFAYHLVKESAEKGYNNILSGFAGDQLLRGSLYAVKDLFRKGNIKKALEYITDYSVYTNSSAYQNTIKYVLKADVGKEYYRKNSKQYSKVNKTIKDIKDFSKKEIYIQINSAKAHLYTDRVIGGLFGVDIKHPFLDRKLIEYVYNLPVELAFKPDYSKYILRKAFSNDLTEKIISRLNKTTHLQYFYKSLKMNWLYVSKFIEDPYVVHTLKLVSQEYWEDNFIKWRNGMEVEFDFLTVLSIEVWFNKYFEELKSN